MMLFSVLSNLSFAKDALTEVSLIRVVDGDTLVVHFQNEDVKLRLIGVDTPESVHPDAEKNSELGKKASEYTKALLKDVKNLYIKTDVASHDKYGRLLAYVYLKDTDGLEDMLNARLLKDGYAKVLTVPPNVRYQKEFLELSREAMVNKRGLYAEGEKNESPGGTPTNQKLYDVVFESKDVHNNPITSGIWEFTDSKGNPVIKIAPNEKQTRFEFQLPEGTYHLRQLEAPEGYMKSNVIATFSLPYQVDGVYGKPIITPKLVREPEKPNTPNEPPTTPPETPPETPADPPTITIDEPNGNTYVPPQNTEQKAATVIQKIYKTGQIYALPAIIAGALILTYLKKRGEKSE